MLERNDFALTGRQLQVLRLVSEGNTVAQIARKLFLSHCTVKAHLHNIYTKLQVNCREEAVQKVFGKPITPADPACDRCPLTYQLPITANQLRDIADRLEQTNGTV